MYNMWINIIMNELFVLYICIKNSYLKQLLFRIDHYYYIYKLLISDRNTWNHIIVCKVLVLMIVTWSYIHFYKCLSLGTWNHIIVYKLLIFD